MLFTIVLSLVILSCILLILVILAQNSKGGGLSSQFGGAGASNMIGVKKTGDLLENVTWGLIIAMFVLVITSSFLIGTGQQSTDVLQDRANETTIVPPSMDLNTNESGEGTLDLGDELSTDTVN